MQHILQHLFKADTLVDVPRERLEALVEEYPSFGMARYLLSRKLQTEQAEHFVEETRRTNLYFPNPFWLQWLLQQAAPAADIQKPVEGFAEIAAPVVAEPPVTEQPIAETVLAESQVAQAIAEPPVAEQPVAEASVAEPQVAEQPAEETVKMETSAAVEPPLVFESYHMIDYFASQGIKLAPDENPSDRLGKQLKSFTEWLKVMKRLPQKEGGTVPDVIAENKVQAIAAHSIEGREVVTETMAEVLAKQGMREKATEVYRKLSLLNPGKSGYFADKIEQLKTN